VAASAPCASAIALHHPVDTARVRHRALGRVLPPDLLRHGLDLRLHLAYLLLRHPLRAHEMGDVVLAAADGRGGVELEGVRAHVDLPRQALGLDRVVQAGLADVAPGADHVGPHVDRDQRSGEPAGASAGECWGEVIGSSVIGSARRGPGVGRRPTDGVLENCTAVRRARTGGGGRVRSRRRRRRRRRWNRGLRRRRRRRPAMRRARPRPRRRPSEDLLMIGSSSPHPGRGAFRCPSTTGPSTGGPASWRRRPSRCTPTTPWGWGTRAATGPSPTPWTGISPP
jgi:hypothetical protein